MRSPRGRPERLVRERDRLRGRGGRAARRPPGGRDAGWRRRSRFRPTGSTSPRSWSGSGRTSPRFATALAVRSPGRQAARLSGAGARARSQHDGRQGERRRDHAAGHRDEGRARKVPGTAREPRVKPFLLVLSSPSGGGKTSIAKKLLQARDDLGYSVSATTRPRRERRARRRRLPLPHARGVPPAAWKRASSSSGPRTPGNLYGTLRSEIDRIFARGRTRCSTSRSKARDRSAQTFRTRCTCSCCRRRRTCWWTGWPAGNTEAPAVIRERITRAADELAAVAEYDYAIVNEDLVARRRPGRARSSMPRRGGWPTGRARPRSSSGCGATFSPPRRRIAAD